MIAMIVIGHVLTKKGYLIRFFFPLFLIYILLLPIYIIVSFIYVLLNLNYESQSTIKSYLKMFLNLPIIFISLKGTLINIDNEENKLRIKIV